MAGWSLGPSPSLHWQHEPPQMHDLIPLAPGALTTAEINAAVSYAAAEKAAATRAIYSADWRAFSAWCGARVAAPLPAHPGLRRLPLRSGPGRAQSRHHRPQGRRHRPPHKLAGHEPPTNMEGVKAVPRGIRRHRPRTGPSSATPTFAQHSSLGSDNYQ